MTTQDVGSDTGTLDVAIVGGGPAGSAAALRILAADPRRTVAIFDAARFPRDKTCGDGISMHSASLLAGLGASSVLSGCPEVPTLRIRAPRGAEVAHRVRRPNRVVPRAVFDHRLLELARARGAAVHHHRVRSWRSEGGVVVLDETIRARVVIGADGAHSVVRRGLDLPRRDPRAVALAVRGYAPVPDDYSSELFIAVAERNCPAYAWVFPIGDGRANIGFGVFAHQLDGGRAELWSRLADALPGLQADPDSLRAHQLPLSTDRPRQPDGRVLLAGDAANLVNPLTGEGIHYALLSGDLAGQAALTGPEAGRRYRKALESRLGTHLRHTSAMARWAQRPRFVDAVVAASRDRAVFDMVTELGLGTGTVDARGFAAVLRQCVASTMPVGRARFGARPT